ncbi:MAG: hypothetical protein ABEJ76_03395 [Halanaeroarchaeum sp.]
MTEREHSVSGPAWLFGLRATLHSLLPVALVAILGVLYVEYVAHLEGLHHEVVLLQRGVMVYFVLHVAVEFVLYDDSRAFVRENWLDVLLVVPFLTAFRLAGELAQLARSARVLALLEGFETGRLLERVAALTVVGAVDSDEAVLARESLVNADVTKTSSREDRLAYEVKRSSSRLRFGGAPTASSRRFPRPARSGTSSGGVPRGAGRVRRPSRYLTSVRDVGSAAVTRVRTAVSAVLGSGDG